VPTETRPTAAAVTLAGLSRPSVAAPVRAPGPVAARGGRGAASGHRRFLVLPSASAGTARSGRSSPLPSSPRGTRRYSFTVANATRK
jgi:hypothetical protein